MSYQDVLVKLSDAAGELVARLWRLVENGTITQEMFVDQCAVVVQIARRRGEHAALLSLRAAVEVHEQTPRPAADVIRPEELDRLHRALNTVLGSDQDTIMQLVRLATNEVLQAANAAFTEGMKQTPKVQGWSRRLESDACQLCRWWWRDGTVWPVDHVMPTHPGCTCTQKPYLGPPRDERREP